jgi:hypothetical protein
MTDLSKEMRPGKSVSPKMRQLLNKEKAQAKKRIIERGIVHFRADSQFMEALLTASEELKIAPGTLCRQIVWDQLQRRVSKTKVTHFVTEAVDSGSISSAENDLFKQSKKLIASLEVLQQIFSDLQGMDLDTAMDQLKHGQEEIRGELKELKKRLAKSS